MKNVPKQSNAMEVQAVKKEPVWSVQKIVKKDQQTKKIQNHKNKIVKKVTQSNVSFLGTS